jgi:hypothetical protein
VEKWNGFGLEKGPVARAFEHENELLDCIKDGEFVE